MPQPPRLAPDDLDARFIRRVVILIVLIAVAAAIYKAGDLLILAFGATLGAVAIHAIAEKWARVPGVSNRVAMGLAIATVLAILGFLGWLFGVQFAPQVNALVTRLPSLIAQLEGWASRSPVGAKIVNAVQAAYAGSRIAQDIGGLVAGGGELILNCLLLFVGALFFAADPKVYERGFLLLFPAKTRPAFHDALCDAAGTLRLWLRAQLILMTSMGLLVGVGLWISGVPSAAALGLMAGISEFIPYIGPTVAMLPALGLGATVGTGPLIGALVTYAVVRLFQTNFITPYVQARVVAIPPAITLFAIIAIGIVFGLFGLFFSAALLVVIFSLIRSLYLRDVLGEDVDAPSHESSMSQSGDATRG